jgi:hypothetical protein
LKPIQPNVILIGGRGAGKTSWLGALLQISTGSELLGPIVVDLANETGDAVLENLAELKTKCAQIEQGAKHVTIDRLPTSSGLYPEYPLEVHVDGRRRLTLNFFDTGGEDLDVGTKENPLRANLVEKMKLCAAAVLAVDTVALHEQDRLSRDDGADGTWMRNRPEAVLDIVSQWLEQSNGLPRIMCVVLLKCETYLYAPNGRRVPGAVQQLVAMVAQCYSKVLERVAEFGGTVVVTCPVQTSACLRFDGFVSGPSAKDYAVEKWKGIPRDGAPGAVRSYGPVDCELPLGYILNFFLTQAERNREERKRAEEERYWRATRNTPRLPGWLRNRLPLPIVKVLEKTAEGVRNVALRVRLIFNEAFLQPALSDAIRELSARCVRTDGSVIIEGARDLLTPPRTW